MDTNTQKPLYVVKDRFEHRSQNFIIQELRRLSGKDEMEDTRLIWKQLKQKAGIKQGGMTYIPFVPALPALVLKTERKFIVLLGRETFTSNDKDSLKLWLAHELGHICQDAPKAECEPFERLKLSEKSSRALLSSSSKQKEYVADWFASQVIGYDTVVHAIQTLPKFCKELRDPLEPSNGFSSHPTALERVQNLHLSNETFIHLPEAPKWYQSHAPIDPTGIKYYLIDSYNYFSVGLIITCFSVGGFLGLLNEWLNPQSR